MEKISFGFNPAGDPNQVFTPDNKYVGHIETNASGDGFIVNDLGKTVGFILDNEQNSGSTMWCEQ